MKQLSAPLRAQVGGTLIGLVIGLLVGLGIALAVAVYVTRVPVPFVDRGVSRSPAKDVEEAERNKGWNPNAGLSSQQSPLPATEGAAPGAEGAPAVEAPSGSGLDGDPLGDLLRDKLGDTPAVPAAAPASPGAASSPAAPAKAASAATGDAAIYFVQAGAFRAPDDAQAQRARLAMLGMAAEITEREQSGRTVYRVRIGPFNQKPLAEATRVQLEANSVDAALVRIQR
ncbi:SPOR domain-containing protein [Hydrogenophaga sp. PAMC20947]|uniref:SPOR domain-containing protein n=1 Tax=Hydrogenophaga sp. PAMC20947 TaxID=2565558 RepID=UPI00109E0F27|nr:SPOR domain-containing protein [Hydrogenophaga sp. PAMC20947]QCB47356.1 sporulation protein [Hydrogenophaga sp. PAMC20947]